MTDQGILPLYPAAYLTWNPLPYLIETIHHWFDEPVEVKNARSSKDPVRNLTGQIWSEKDQHWKTPGIVESKPIPPPTLTELESAGQQLFDGFEVYLSPSNPKKQKASTPWKPRQRTLAQVKGYFQGYLAHGRDIYARRKHIAARLGMSVRTLARYLAFLAAEGWIETVKRTARTAIRKVLSILNLSPGTVPSSDPPIEEPQSTKVLRQQMFSPSVVWVYPSNHRRDLKPTERTGIPPNLPFEVWRKLREKLRGASEWIERASNPAAYENAIVKRELERAGFACARRFQQTRGDDPIAGDLQREAPGQQTYAGG